MKKFPDIELEKYSVAFSGYKYSISFVCKTFTEDTLKVLCDLSRAYKKKLNIFAPEKNFLKSVKMIKEKQMLDENELSTYSNSWQDFVEDKKELAKIYNASKINLNIGPKDKTLKNYPIFEILASGGFLITNEIEDLSKYFEISRHLETFKNSTDLIDKIDFYLLNLDIAQKLALYGKVEIIKAQALAQKTSKNVKKD